MTNNTTKESADKSFFVFVKDTITGKIKRVVVPSDLQVGLLGSPSELQLIGRLSLNAVSYDSTASNQGVIKTKNSDTIIGVNNVTTPASNRISVTLPSTPRNGQLHYVKDLTGTASIVAIDIFSSDGTYIDGVTNKTIVDSYGSIGLYYFDSLVGKNSSIPVSQRQGGWKVFSTTSGGSGAPSDARYVVLSTNTGLSNERVLTAGSGILIADGGPKGPISISATGAASGADPNAAYLVVSLTSSLTAERSLAAGVGITITDNGPNSTFVISSTATGGSGADVSASYVTVGNTGSLPNERSLIAGSNISIVDGGGGSTITVSATGVGDPGAAYVVLGLTSSLSSERLLSAGTQIAITDGGPGGNVVVNSLAADSSASYVVVGLTSSLANERALTAGTGITITDNGPNNSIVISSTAGSGGSVPIFSSPILAGVATTNVALSGSKQSIGMLTFNPTLINKFSGTRAYYYRAILDTTDTLVSASVDLYDLNGIVSFPPASIAGSIMSSSKQTSIEVQSLVSSQLSIVTGSGIFEARLWKTVSGSITSSVSCRNARIEIEYT